MSSVDRIHTAELDVAKLQVGLAAVQDGLQRAESVARAAEVVERGVKGSTKLLVGLVGLSVVVLALAWFRHQRDDATADRR